MINQTIKDRVLQSIKETNEFFENITVDELRSKLLNLPSNTVGAQAWCIIGARESYMKAYVAGKWVGFECSLTEIYDASKVKQKLVETAKMVEDLMNQYPDKNEHQLIDLLEHEVMHHGQLIRYAYANRILFPMSWIHKYALDQVKPKNE
ncbi:hypothetical protein JV173_02245 [Acholeplasma equirhinis]|uniref:hypothetical protein n=1 Tax=Acholeplasma equirhinis TaxID=555393 RepID=UPI00197AEF25|nr:hypothetical protein [Acholeplasma equirhinis]MBN3490327.1 hypothetical protein [Acholeplasma equirhinis]